MGLTAKDFMTKEVYCVNLSTTLEEIAQLVISKRISGLPILDNNGKLVGVISKTDLLTHGLEKELQSLLSEPDHQDEAMELFDFDNLLGAEPSKVTVEQVMKTNVITASKNTSINEIVKLMLKHKIHRIIIVENDKVIGIVTPMDVLKMIDTD